MSGYIRQIQSSDGTPITAPSTIALSVEKLLQYANDAAYEAAHGAGEAGDLYFNTTDQQVRYYKNGGWEYHLADESVYDNTGSGLTANDVQAAIDEVESRVDTAETDIATAEADIIANAADIADIRTTQGTSDGDTNLGTFTGTTISDNGSVKAGMQELETAHEAHTGATSVHGATGNVFGLGDNPSFTSTGGIKLPAGTTAQRPTPTNGHIRYNSDISAFEGYQGGSWGELGGGGSGVGGKNYILNPDAAIDTTNITNTATSGSWTIARTTTAAELPEETKGTAFKISGSGLTVGDTVEWAIEATGIDDADGGIMGRAKASILDISGTSGDGEYSAQVWDDTDSVYIGEEKAITGTGTYYLDVPFYATHDYEFHLKAEIASPTNIGISGVTIEPVSTVTGAVTTKWESYTPTFQGLGTVTSRLQWRQVGQNIEIMGDFTAGTIPATTEAQISLPNSYTVSLLGTTDTAIVGLLSRDTSDTINQHNLLATDGDTFLNIGRWRNDAATNPMDVENSENIIGATNRCSVWASVPIAELERSGYLPTISDVKYENVRFSAYSNNETATTGNPWAFATADYNEGGGTFASGVYTAPAAGYYRVSTTLRLTVASNTVGIYVNGTVVIVSATDDTSACATKTVLLAAGDTVEVRNVVGSNRTTQAAAGQSAFEVIRVPDYSAKAAGLPLSDNADTTQQYLLPLIQDSGDLTLPTLTGWNGTTPPTINYANSWYRWHRIGNQVTLQWAWDSTAAGTTDHSANYWVLPSSVPYPKNYINDYANAHVPAMGTGFMRQALSGQNFGQTSLYYQSSSEVRVYTVNETATNSGYFGVGTITYIVDD